MSCCLSGSPLCLSVSSGRRNGGFYIFCVSQHISRTVANLSLLMTVFSCDFLQPSLNFLWNSSCIEISDQIINILVSNMKASAEPLSCGSWSILLGNPEGSFPRLARFVFLFAQHILSTYLEPRGWAKFATWHLHTRWLLGFNALVCKMGVWIRWAWEYPRF